MQRATKTMQFIPGKYIFTFIMSSCTSKVLREIKFLIVSCIFFCHHLSVCVSSHFITLPCLFLRSDRQEIDASLFTVEDLMDDTSVRLPGSIEGHPFTISNCLKASIFLFDHINSVTITDCKDCTIFLGPTKNR